MINITYFIIFQFFLIIYLLFLLFFEIRVLYFGCIIIFCQSITLFLAIFNRAFSDGFSISFFLYIVIVPVILPYLVKIFSFRNPNSLLKKLSFLFKKHLDDSFFNILLINKGFFYFSRKFFKKNEEFFRKVLKKPLFLKNLFILYPWIGFIIFLIFEILFFKKIYFAAILLSLNILFYRLFLILLRIIEYSCVEYLQIINTQYFFSSCQEPLPSFFINSQNFIKIMDNNENSQEEYLLNKWIICFSSITYASSYFYSNILRKYLSFYYRNILNCITLVVVLLGWVQENLEKFPFLSTFVPFMIFAIIKLLAGFIFRERFQTADFLIKHLFAIRLTFSIYRKELIESNCVSAKNIENMVILTPPAWSWKPESFSEYFQGFEYKNFDYRFFRKPVIFHFVIYFVKKYFRKLFV